MGFIWLFLAALVLAVALFAVSGRIEGWTKPTHFTDRDADGEPDEPGGPAGKL